jgi:predicted glycosyltransferase
MTIRDPRLDLLIYAHDGRGLGHVSRSVAVGAAVRRLFPKLKILLMTGCKQTDLLIGPAPLDWVKLPSYKKVVINGTPVGCVGHTNLKNSYLVKSRATLIQSIVEEYRPRCVLVDHEAPGKRKELISSIELETDTQWILGLRGIIGLVDDVWSDLATTIFKKHYCALLWYGDASVLGKETLDTIKERFDTQPIITGYVSRLREMKHWFDISQGSEDKPYAGTIAVPWESESSNPVISSLYHALSKIGDQYGEWQIFMNFGQNIFKDLPFCTVQDLSPRYLYALANSKTAVIYGGYNSIIDVLSVNIPAVVILRNIDDMEQEEHVKKILDIANTSLLSISESKVDSHQLQKDLKTQLQASTLGDSGINLDGAATAAQKLNEYITGY